MGLSDLKELQDGCAQFTDKLYIALFYFLIVIKNHWVRGLYKLEQLLQPT